MEEEVVTLKENTSVEEVKSSRWWIRFVVMPILVVLIGGYLGYWLKWRIAADESEANGNVISAIQIMDNSDLPMYLTDADFKITYVNDAYVSFFAVEKSMLIGNPIWTAMELSAKFVPDSLQAQFSQYQEEIQSRAIKELLPHADDIAIFDLRASPNIKDRRVYKVRIHIDKIYSRTDQSAIGLFGVLIPTEIPDSEIPANTSGKYF